MTDLAQKQALSIFTVAAVLIGFGVVLQLWLLSASLEVVLLGKDDFAFAATAASAALLAVNGGLLAYVLRIDRRVRTLDTRRDG